VGIKRSASRSPILKSVCQILQFIFKMIVISSHIIWCLIIYIILLILFYFLSSLLFYNPISLLYIQKYYLIIFLSKFWSFPYHFFQQTLLKVIKFFLFSNTPSLFLKNICVLLFLLNLCILFFTFLPTLINLQLDPFLLSPKCVRAIFYLFTLIS